MSSLFSNGNRRKTQLVLSKLAWGACVMVLTQVLGNLGQLRGILSDRTLALLAFALATLLTVSKGVEMFFDQTVQLFTSKALTFEEPPQPPQTAAQPKEDEMKTKITVTLAIAMLAVASCNAATIPTDAAGTATAPPAPDPAAHPSRVARMESAAKAWVHPASGELFGKETVVDLSTTYTAAEPNGLRNLLRTSVRGGPWGANLGAYQFTSRYTGFGFDIGFDDRNRISSHVVDYVSTTFILRLPVDSLHTAVSGVGAVGRDWASGLYFFQLGPRVDFRLNRNLGVFADSRFTFRTAQDKDSLQVRFGLSMAFK